MRSAASLLIAGLCLLLHIHNGVSQTMDQIINMAMPSSDAMDLNQDENTVKVELDMLFTREDWDEIQQLNSETYKRRHKRKATRDTRKRWTNNVVPYSIANHFSSADIQQIQAGMDDWERYTCLNFRQANSRDANRIYIYSGSGCSSYVGMIGGQQQVSLAQGCRQKGVIVHELGHAIGFHHEQTRPDRDGYVQILTHNIQRGTEYNFQRYSTAVQHDYDVSYDYTSVMHYGQYAFSANGQPTIRTIDASKQNQIGNRYGHSFRDIKLANLMYNCAGQCGSKTCPGEGFVGKDCQCYCPGSPVTVCSGTGGGGGGDECMDEHVNCASWAASRECIKNPTWMLVHCKSSCDSCEGGGGGVVPCQDGNTYCVYWAGQGFCDSGSVYAPYMLETCKQSCQLCGSNSGGTGTGTSSGGGGPSCEDADTGSCPYWAGNGECYRNPAYMLQSCKKSCNAC